jgi:hypothetical protein
LSQPGAFSAAGAPERSSSELCASTTLGTKDSRLRGEGHPALGAAAPIYNQRIFHILEVFVRNLLAFAFIYLMLIIGSSAAQLPTPLGMQGQDPPFGREKPKDPTEEKMEHEREKAMNKQRQTSLQKDTDHLLELATQLKAYVDKSNEHTLSLDVVKKADEIEKLAKSVKEKMRGSN